MYDAVLYHKKGTDGLNFKEVTKIFNLLKEDDAYPLDIEAEIQECAAEGFITRSGANLLDYNLENLRKGIIEILEDVSKEVATGIYEICGLKVKLMYSRR